MRSRLIVALLCLFVSMASFVYGADQHVLGAIMAIDATLVEVKTTKGQSVNLRVDKNTRYRDESNPKGATRPAVGDRVVIMATKSDKKGDNALIATEIYFSSIKRVPILPQPVPAE
jgi:hypothetical protein